MATLTIPNTAVAGQDILASEWNANFTAITNWSTTISNDNLTTMTGAVTWSVSSNSLALSIANSGTEGSISVNHSGVLASAKAAFKVSSAAAQTTGDALAYLTQTNASSTIPTLLVNQSGTGEAASIVSAAALASGKSGLKVASAVAQTAGDAVAHVTSTHASTTIPALRVNQAGTGKVLQTVSTTAPSVPAPVMTTTQRNTITGAAGDRVYNSTLKRPEHHDGTAWRGLPNLSIVSKTTTYTATTDDDVILCDTSGGAWTLSLHTAANHAGKQLRIKKTTSDFSALTINTNSTETVDGVDNTAIHTQYEELTLVSDGTNWHILNRHMPSVWTSYSSTCGLTGGTNTVTALWRREGDSMRCRIDATFNPVFTGGSATYTIPSGPTIDTAKLPGSVSSSNTPKLGFAICNDVGNAVYSASVFYESTSTVSVRPEVDDTGTSSNFLSFTTPVGTTAPFTWSNSDRMYLEFLVPISGWNG